MKITLTAKLKLLTTPDQFRALRATQLAYRDALNFVSAYSFAHGKTSNRKRLQKETYADLRGQFGLPAQMACNVPRQVGSTYQALWTKAKKNAEARRLGYTKKRYKGLDKPPQYVSPTLTYNLGRDYSCRTDQQVSILTLAGASPCPLSGLRHVALLQQGASIGGAKLWYDRAKQRFYLLVSLTIETPDPRQSAFPRWLASMSGSGIWPRWLPWTMARSSTRERKYEQKRTITPDCKNDFSEKALAAPHGEESRWARERDG